MDSSSFMTVPVDSLDMAIAVGLTELINHPGWTLTICQTLPASPYTAIIAVCPVIPQPSGDCPDPKPVLLIPETAVPYIRTALQTLILKPPVPGIIKPS